MKNEVNQVLGDIRVMTIARVEETVYSCLIKWNSTIQWQTVKISDSTYEDPSQANDF